MCLVLLLRILFFFLLPFINTHTHTHSSSHSLKNRYSVYLLDNKICCSESYRNDLGLNITASDLSSDWAYSMDFSTFMRSFGSMMELVMLSGWPTLMEGAEASSPQGLGDLSARTFFFTYKLLFYLLVQPMMAGFMIQCVMTAWNEYERRHRFIMREKKIEDDDNVDSDRGWKSKILDYVKCCFCIVNQKNLDDDEETSEYREWEEEEEDENYEGKRDSTFQRQDSKTIRVIRKRRKSEILRRMVAYHHGETAADDDEEEEEEEEGTESKNSSKNLRSKIDHLERIIQEQNETIQELRKGRLQSRGRSTRLMGTLEHSLIRDLDEVRDGSTVENWDGKGLL